MVFGQQLAAATSEAMVALLAQDVRLAAVSERMLAGNRELCRQHMPLAGVVLHSADQYRPEIAGDAFANGRIAIGALVPGTPAAAELAPGDGIVAIGGQRTGTLTAEGEHKLRDAAFELLAAQPEGAPLALTVARDGREQAVSLMVPSGCRALVEIRSTSGLNARSDGRVIQVNYSLAAAATDEELAVVFAHELGHLVLEHRRRLSEAGVKKGFFGEFGRNRRYNRQVEIEADQISVHLLANAGYDPAIAPRFWRSRLGRRVDDGIFRSATNLSPEGRAALMEQEIAAHLSGHSGTSIPAHLMRKRDQAFD
jgi:Zn-dependent protease with chaperone function